MRHRQIPAPDWQLFFTTTLSALMVAIKPVKAQFKLRREKMYNKSKTIVRWLFIAAVTAFVGTSQAYWHHADLAAAIAEAESVDDAVNIAKEALERDHFEIVLVVDHQAAAKSVDLELRPTKVIFARPPKRLERALLRRSETIGIDLPVKVLVFEDADGAIQTRFNPEGYIADRHDFKIFDPDLWRMNRAVNKFVELDNGLVTVLSNRSAQDTSLAIQAALDATGVFRIPLVFNYSEGSRKRDKILIVFGNPLAGTPLMQATQEVAIDLPQKFLIWEDRHDNVFITYNDPFFIAKRHNVQGQDARLTAISNALAKFASAGAGE